VRRKSQSAPRRAYARGGWSTSVRARRVSAACILLVTTACGRGRMPGSLRRRLAGHQPRLQAPARGGGSPRACCPDRVAGVIPGHRVARCVAGLTAWRCGPSIAAYAARLTTARGADAHMSSWSGGRFAFALTGYRVKPPSNFKRHNAAATHGALDLLSAYPEARFQSDHADLPSAALGAAAGPGS
jgi:hypothetical protein